MPLLLGSLALSLAGCTADQPAPEQDALPTRSAPPESAEGSPEAADPSASIAPSEPGDAGAPAFDPVPGQALAARPAPLRPVFADDRFLVAYYGTAQTATMGVLGEDDPDGAYARLQEAAAPFARPDSDVDLVFELIVTVADPIPGADGDFSHDIPRSEVERYVEASRRLGVRLLLDVQPGRSDFLTVARRWTWALREPHVGLALDPEWRMAAGEKPGEVIGQVDASEVNEVSRWLADLTERRRLPQKLFVLHQFRTDMVTGIEDVEKRRRLAMVQHVDGFGPPGQKIDTYRTVARPRTFRMGFKLFYDEDVGLMSAEAVRALRPRVRFVSFQ